MDYLLEWALRSMAGGNMAAAAARFGWSRDALQRSASAAGDAPWSEDTSCRLGDICGSQVCASLWLLSGQCWGQLC